MELKQAALVIVDISGYTRFIQFHKTSLIHAQEIISQLLESVIDRASHPLTLNKLEGDAALLYAELGNDEAAALRDIFAQVTRFFAVFHAKAGELSGSRSGCSCDACQRIRDLRLKAILHRGAIAFRKIRQFDEMTGEDVILVHRLLKNTITEHEYIMVTEAFYRQLDDSPEMAGVLHEEVLEDLGPVRARVFFPSAE